VKITRFTYNPEAATIGDPLDLISRLSGSVDHNSGRMTFGPDGRTIYVIIDSTGPMQAIKGGPIADQWNPDSLIEFRYEGFRDLERSTSPIT
jgi:glucose/arabinose dehydrogenase